jgi:membrane associated rhomboid family serine protease
MNIRHNPIVWTIALLCIAAYVLDHVVQWQTLELYRTAWRGMGRAAAFRTMFFWSFAPVSTLLHTGLVHLAVNLWCLAKFGTFVERRHGGIVVLCLWIVSACAAMGIEALVGGVGRIGLSAVTYAMLGMTLVNWREAARSPQRRWTGIGMLLFLLAGGLERLGLPPLAPEVAHVAHAAGLLTGLIFVFALRSMGHVEISGKWPDRPLRA